MFDKEAFKKYLTKIGFYCDPDYYWLLKKLDNKENLYSSLNNKIKEYVTDENRQECINYVKSCIEAQVILEKKLETANSLLEECEQLAEDNLLSFSMPRVSGVRFGVDEYGGIGWDRSDYSC
jgi:hypothetical protein